METNQALLEALALLGESELPEAVHTPRKRAYKRRAPKQAPQVARFNQVVTMSATSQQGTCTRCGRSFAECFSAASCDANIAAAAAPAPVAPALDAPLSKVFVTAGKATFTISKLETGERFTYRIEKPENFRGEYFGSVMKGSDNENDYRYIGMVSARDLSLRFTKGSKFAADSKEARGLAFALAVVMGRKTLPAGYELRRSNKCGRCGRLLTVPSSIDAGIGPDCADMMGVAA